MRHLRILILVYFMVFLSPVDANPEIIQAAEKYNLLNNALILKVIPSGGQNLLRYNSFSSNIGLINDDIRVLISELQYRRIKQDLTVKSLFVMNMPQLSNPALSSSYYEFMADINLQQTRKLTLDQFSLQNSGKTESQLDDQLKRLLLIVKGIVDSSDELESLCEDLNLKEQYSEFIEALAKIK